MVYPAQLILEFDFIDESILGIYSIHNNVESTIYFEGNIIITHTKESFENFEGVKILHLHFLTLYRFFNENSTELLILKDSLKELRTIQNRHEEQLQNLNNIIVNWVGGVNRNLDCSCYYQEVKLQSDDINKLVLDWDYLYYWSKRIEEFFDYVKEDYIKENQVKKTSI